MGTAQKEGVPQIGCEGAIATLYQKQANERASRAIKILDAGRLRERDCLVATRQKFSDSEYSDSPWNVAPLIFLLSRTAMDQRSGGEFSHTLFAGVAGQRHCQRSIIITRGTDSVDSHGERTATEGIRRNGRSNPTNLEQSKKRVGDRVPLQPVYCLCPMQVGRQCETHKCERNKQ